MLIQQNSLSVCKRVCACFLNVVFPWTHLWIKGNLGVLDSGLDFILSVPGGANDNKNPGLNKYEIQTKYEAHVKKKEMTIWQTFSHRLFRMEGYTSVHHPENLPIQRLWPKRDYYSFLVTSLMMEGCYKQPFLRGSRVTDSVPIRCGKYEMFL